MIGVGITLQLPNGKDALIAFDTLIAEIRRSIACYESPMFVGGSQILGHEGYLQTLPDVRYGIYLKDSEVAVDRTFVEDIAARTPIGEWALEAQKILDK